jgi:hypothetical protein
MNGSRSQIHVSDEGSKDFTRYAIRLDSSEGAPGNDITARLGKTGNSMDRNGLDQSDDDRKKFESVFGVEDVEMERFGVPTKRGLETRANRL